MSQSTLVITSLFTILVVWLNTSPPPNITISFFRLFCIFHDSANFRASLRLETTWTSSNDLIFEEITIFFRFGKGWPIAANVFLPITTAFLCAGGEMFEVRFESPREMVIYTNDRIIWDRNQMWDCRICFNLFQCGLFFAVLILDHRSDVVREMIS